MLRILPRPQIDADAWNTCVTASPHRITYGFSWYLDIVLPAPGWKWVGLVIMNEAGGYQAVMPIPLRRKSIAGITYEWVVHQPLFCHFLAVFSRDPELDSRPFFQLMNQQFRYGSVVNLSQKPANTTSFDTLRVLTTHTLDLSVNYERIYQNYTYDRKVNLRRALRMNWVIVDSTNPDPLLNLFRENHADTISGGVADWAYEMLRNLTNELNQRGLATLRYATRDGRIEAGALFVQEGNRVIYLFNAASEIGRKGNARTLLIDQMIREKAGGHYLEGEPCLFDFESPGKQSIRRFYQSFGAVEEPFWTMHWSRLTKLERLAQRIRNVIKKAPVTT
ncbi:GNAT family N-acetyltransferase [Spirosoma validum]|nr:GNAT family N-acetyltransferase [Spirosoma validum]